MRDTIMAEIKSPGGFEAEIVEAKLAAEKISTHKVKTGGAGAAITPEGLALGDYDEEGGNSDEED